jgi:hypothetical protein
VKKPAKTYDERNRKAQQTRKARLARILKSVPATLCIDLLKLTVCCRYAESLLKNPRVKRYLIKHHPKELSDLETLLAHFGEQPAASEAA